MAAMTPARFAHQFEDPMQQLEAARVGIWVFLATEVLFFGVMIFSYTVYRIANPVAFALAGDHMNLKIGTINTALLLTSSLCAALSVRYARAAARGKLALALTCTAGIGLLFDALKVYEYHDHFKEGFLPGASWTYAGPQAPAVELLFVHYYVMTGVHAVHVLIGVGLFTVLAAKSLRGKCQTNRGTAVEISALYWHFVDVVWIFLYPLFYFLGGASK